MVLLGLKVAILENGKTQRQVAAEAEIPETRLSSIVRGWATPTEEERSRLAKVLARPAALLFERQTA